MSRQRWLVSTTLALVVFAALVVVFAAPASSPPADSTCDQPIEEKVRQVSDKVSLVPRPGTVLAFRWNFEHRRSVFSDVLVLVWADRSSPNGISVGDFLELTVKPPRNASNSREIPLRNLSFYAAVGGDKNQAGPDRLILKLCASSYHAPPGTYATVIQFADPDIQAAPIDVSLTVKESDLRVPLLAILGGLYLAVVVLILRWSESDRFSWPRAVVGIILGVIGVIPAAIALFADDPTWGAKSFFDPFTLFATVALGLLGSSAIAEAIPVDIRLTSSGSVASAPAPKSGGE